MTNINNVVRHPEFIPDQQWKEWTHEKLPSSKNLWICDIDTMLRTRNGCVMLIEIKRRSVDMKSWQRGSYGLLAAALANSEGQTLNHPLMQFSLELKKFLGVYTLIFEKSWFNDGRVYLSINGNPQYEVTEQEVIDIFSMTEYCIDCFPCKLCMTCEACKEALGIHDC